MSRAPSAMRSGGTQTSSMISAVPGGRSRPISPCIPSRTDQASSTRSWSRVQSGSLISVWPARTSAAFASRASSPASSSAPNSTSRAADSPGQLAPLLGCPGNRVAGHDQRRRHHQLHRPCAGRDEVRHGRHRRLEAIEVEPGDHRAGRHRHRLEDRLRDERQRPLGADQQAAEDLDRLVLVEEGAEPVADRVLDPELRPDPLARARSRRGSRRGSPRGPALSSGSAAANRSAASGAAVSIVVPDGSTKVSERTVE